MELIDVILSKGNLNRAYKKVVANKGASGVDGVTVEELGDYIRVSDLSEVENGKLYNLKEKLLSQNPKCRTCKVNPFCWNCIATIKENTENGAMDDYCSKVKAFYFNTVWGE